MGNEYALREHLNQIDCRETEIEANAKINTQIMLRAFFDSESANWLEYFNEEEKDQLLNDMAKGVQEPGNPSGILDRLHSNLIVKIRTKAYDMAIDDFERYGPAED